MNQTHWRCPFCCGTDIEVYGVQSFEVGDTYHRSAKVQNEVYDPVGDLTITHVLCLNCNAEDDDDKDWHMTAGEWLREKEIDDAERHRELLSDR